MSTGDALECDGCGERSADSERLLEWRFVLLHDVFRDYCERCRGGKLHWDAVQTRVKEKG